MKITVKAIDTDGKAYAEIVTNTPKHPFMMMIRKFIWYVVDCYEDKVRIDVEWNCEDNAFFTHMEITYGEKWYLTYVENEFFCDTAVEFDTKGELIEFVRDILKNLDDTDRAMREWD